MQTTLPTRANVEWCFTYNNGGGIAYVCARKPPTLPSHVTTVEQRRGGCVCVRDRTLYFGRSSRRKRVGEISSDNGSSFRCVRATILLRNMCVRYNIILYRLPPAPHAPPRQITTIWSCACKMKFGCNVPRGNRKNRQTY